jgi:hypothetical protein
MNIPLHRKEIVQLFRLFSEAERSVHRLLDPSAPWPEFQHYYSMRKRASLRRALELLTKHLYHPFQEISPDQKEQMVKALQPPGLFRILFRSWLARWKSLWHFSIPEVHCMAWTVHTVLDCLENPNKPGSDFLISLRKDFFACATILEYRCFSMREIVQSPPIAHFRQSAWVKTVPVEDFFDEAA